MSLRWPTAQPATPEWEALALAMQDHHAPTPCHGSDAWTAEDAAARAAAVIGCRGCPLLEDCHAAAESTGETFGVWAGIDRGAPKRGRQSA